MVVGTRYAGTTNNLLVLGPGLDPDTTSGIFVKGNGNIGVGEDNPTRKLDVSGDVLGNAFMLKGNTSASASIQAQMYRPENNTLAFATNGNQERLRIKSDGKVLITNTLGLGGATSNPSELLHAQTASGEGKIVVMGATTGTVAISGLNGASRVLFGDSSTENAGNITYTHSSDSLSFRVNGNTRWKFDSSGHFLPDSVGSYNIGSATAEIGNVYIADDKKLYLGSSQDVEIYHSSGNVTMFDSPTNRQVQLKGDGGLLIRAGGNQNIANFVQSAVTLYHNVGNLATIRLTTTSTGITVGGEVAATQDYPDFRPIFDFNFAKVKKLDTRLRCFRTGGASYVDEFGYIKIASYNTPRFDHDPITRDCKGLLIEPSRENKISYTHAYSPSGSGTVESYTGETRSPDGEYNAKKITGSATGGSYNEGTSTTGVFSVFLKAGSTNYVQIQGGGVGMNNSTIGPYTKNTVINLSNGTFTANQQNFTAKQYRDGWWRVSVVYTTGSSYQGTAWSIYALDSSSPSTDTVDNEEHCYAWGQVFEVGSFITSYIPSGPSSNNTRGDENIRIGNTEKYNEFTDMFNAEEGTVITEHEMLSSIANQGVVGFHKDFGNVDRIEVRSQGSGNTTSARFEVVNTNSSIVSMNGNNLAHSGTGINKNNKYAFAFKVNDYAGVVNGGTPETDTSGSVPTGLNSVMIGYTSFGVQSHLYIKRLTLYSQRLSNNQLVTLTS